MISQLYTRESSIAVNYCFASWFAYSTHEMSFLKRMILTEPTNISYTPGVLVSLLPFPLITLIVGKYGRLLVL